MKDTHESGSGVACVAQVQHAKALISMLSGPGGSLNDPAITVLVEAVPNPSGVNWDILERDMATYKSSHWGHPMQWQFLKSNKWGDNRQLETDPRRKKKETENLKPCEFQELRYFQWFYGAEGRKMCWLAVQSISNTWLWATTDCHRDKISCQHFQGPPNG